MIGLMFFGAIGLWIIVAIMIGLKLPKWFKLNGAWAWLFVPLMIFAPVMDEVIALPQAYALCKQAKGAFWYDPSAKGGVMRYGDEYAVEEKVVGFNIKTTVKHYTSVLAKNHQPVIKRIKIYFSSGLLHFPAGSSGGSMPLLLPEECPSSIWSMPKYREVVQQLELTSEPRPNL